MDVERARYVTSPDGMRAVTNHADDALGDPLRLQGRLRKAHSAEHASAIAEQLVLRAKAAERFGASPLPLYSPDGLEMMTHPLVAARRAARLVSLGLPVFDLTAGIGGDLSACAAAGLACCGLDSDPVAALIAAKNVPGAAVALGDAGRPPFDLAAGAVVIDPARRHGARRSADPDAYSPPFELALALLTGARAGVLKTAPGMDHALVPPDAEVEFVQVGRSLREAAIWRGGDAVAGLRRAVRVESGAEIDSLAPEADDTPAPIGAVLLDPHSCVTRAGLVRHLAHRLDARLIDPQLGYLTASQPAFDPLAETFTVLDVVDFSVARLRAALLAGGWRPDEIRRRAFPIEPDELRKLLHVRAGRPVTLFCTTVADKRLVVVAKQLVDNCEAG